MSQSGTCNLSQQPRGGGAGGGGPVSNAPLRVTGGSGGAAGSLPGCTLQIIKTMRNYIADYQEKRGMSRNEYVKQLIIVLQC